MSKFEIGDRVKIRKTSKWYGWNDRNPVDVIGTIVHNFVVFKYPYYVKWDNGRYDLFSEKDLGLVTKGE